jgi:hypothetical protein
MKDVLGIRAANHAALLSDFRANLPCDTSQRGSIKLWAQRIGVSRAYASHLSCRRKTIGHRIARQIEAHLGLEAGWMDREHPSPQPEPQATSRAPIATPPEHSEWVELSRLMLRLYERDRQRLRMALTLAGG